MVKYLQRWMNDNDIQQTVTAKCQLETEPVLEQSSNYITAAVTGILQSSWHQKYAKLAIVTTTWLLTHYICK
jgi:hypothetical protein